MNMPGSKHTTNHTANDSKLLLKEIESRLYSHDQKFDHIISDSDVLKKDSQTLKKDNEILKKDSQTLKKDSQTLKKDTEILKKDTDTLKKSLIGLNSEVTEIKKQINNINDTLEFLRAHAVQTEYYWKAYLDMDKIFEEKLDNHELRINKLEKRVTT
jgi:chromosome segregation ATPase